MPQTTSAFPPPGMSHETGIISNLEPRAPSECTCGKCVDGWLSERMRERLIEEADFQCFVLASFLEDLNDLAPTDLIPEWCISASNSLHYVPMELQDRMTVSFYRGYMLVLEAMLRILDSDKRDQAEPPVEDEDEDESDEESCIPTSEAIRDALRRHGDTESPNAGAEAADVKAFFDAGGQIEYALEALTDRAYEKSPEGPEYRRKPELREEEEEFEKDTEDFAVCAHDLDFELVRVKLGLPARSHGPHWFYLTDDEDSTEGPDDDDTESEAVYVPGEQASSTADV